MPSVLTSRGIGLALRGFPCLCRVRERRVWLGAPWWSWSRMMMLTTFGDLEERWWVPGVGREVNQDVALSSHAERDKFGPKTHLIFLNDLNFSPVAYPANRSDSWATCDEPELRRHGTTDARRTSTLGTFDRTPIARFLDDQVLHPLLPPTTPLRCLNLLRAQWVTYPTTSPAKSSTPASLACGRPSQAPSSLRIAIHHCYHTNDPIVIRHVCLSAWQVVPPEAHAEKMEGVAQILEASTARSTQWRRIKLIHLAEATRRFLAASPPSIKFLAIEGAQDTGFRRAAWYTAPPALEPPQDHRRAEAFEWYGPGVRKVHSTQTGDHPLSPSSLFTSHPSRHQPCGQRFKGHKASSPLLRLLVLHLTGFRADKDVLFDRLVSRVCLNGDGNPDCGVLRRVYLTNVAAQVEDVRKEMQARLPGIAIECHWEDGWVFEDRGLFWIANANIRSKISDAKCKIYQGVWVIYQSNGCKEQKDDDERAQGTVGDSPPASRPSAYATPLQPGSANPDASTAHVLLNVMERVWGGSQRRLKRLLRTLRRIGAEVCCIEEDDGERERVKGYLSSSTRAVARETIGISAVGGRAIKGFRNRRIGVIFSAWLSVPMSEGRIQDAVGVTECERPRSLGVFSRDMSWRVHNDEGAAVEARDPGCCCLTASTWGCQHFWTEMEAAGSIEYVSTEDDGVAHGDCKKSPTQIIAAEAVGGDSSVPDDDGKSHPKRLEILVGGETSVEVLEVVPGSHTSKKTTMDISSCTEVFVKPSTVDSVNHVHCPREVVEEGASPLGRGRMREERFGLTPSDDRG
ncbi:hypothetical protein BKA70DRAFT_1242392 [Coprinopsis sp. MPI-PUGE-AT-0042]|nr:hypothetical protein BKA70DRAFT_1242392 [Coprinopsis sp. MPI-PUGE-AT-0042]